MRRDDINALLRAYAQEQLSPTPDERDFVSRIYASVQRVLGERNCIQIGSYPRFTAVRPLHDLDVLYILGQWDPVTHDPSDALQQLEARLRADYENPTAFDLVVSRQTHSVTLRFSSGGEEKFGVDIVPAYATDRNEFGADMYVVPEIVLASRHERRLLVERVQSGEQAMAWIRSDPRGYIAVATSLNQRNEDFRKAVKLAKGWRAACKRDDPEFPLKSFHLEQAITGAFRADPDLDIFGAIFSFFVRLPDFIRYPQIPDRADPARNIDEYVADLTHADRLKVTQSRDAFLIKLEELGDRAGAVSDLISAGKRKRASTSEAYLFDSGIPMLTEEDFSITATALEREGGFRRKILDRLGIIGTDRKIEFRVGPDAPPADVYKWKVKNDDGSPEPRGEITDHRTLRDPESTKYKGQHFVECFAVRDGICVGRSRQNVVLQWGHA